MWSKGLLLLELYSLNCSEAKTYTPLLLGHPLAPDRPSSLVPLDHLSTVYSTQTSFHSASPFPYPRITRHQQANMSTTHAYYPSYPSGPMPIAMPQKGAYYYPHPQHSYGRVSGSPPEAPESVTTSGVASYEPSATSSSYAGSASDYESSGTTAGVDLIEYMGDRLNGAFNPTGLDRSLAKQAQT